LDGIINLSIVVELLNNALRFQDCKNENDAIFMSQDNNLELIMDGIYNTYGLINNSFDAYLLIALLKVENMTKYHLYLSKALLICVSEHTHIASYPNFNLTMHAYFPEKQSKNLSFCLYIFNELLRNLKLESSNSSNNNNDNNNNNNNNNNSTGIINHFSELKTKNQNDDDIIAACTSLFNTLFNRARILSAYNVSNKYDFSKDLNNCLSLMIKYWPNNVINNIMFRMVRSWPNIGSTTCTLYLNSMDTFLHLIRVSDLVNLPEIQELIFKRLSAQLLSPNSIYSNRTIDIIGAPHVMLNHIAPFDHINTLIRLSLFKASKQHWCKTIQKKAEEIFDSLLDFL